MVNAYFNAQRQQVSNYHHNTLTERTARHARKEVSHIDEDLAARVSRMFEYVSSKTPNISKRGAITAALFLVGAGIGVGLLCDFLDDGRINGSIFTGRTASAQGDSSLSVGASGLEKHVKTGADYSRGNETSDPYGDNDGDGMPNQWEVDNGLNPNNATDADENFDDDWLFNIKEYQNKTDPHNSDTDKDGLEDGNEVFTWKDEDAWMIGDKNHKSDPTDPDTDGDGMPDGFEDVILRVPFAYTKEVRIYLDPTDPSDAKEDYDEDGLSNLGEYNAGTDPAVNDTDEDGMLDGWEVEHGLNPLSSDDISKDPDSDNLTNKQEYDARTNPHQVDSDQDGLPDGYEVSLGFNPKNPVTGNNDTDEDGLSNIKEYELGTNPKASDTDDDRMPDKWEYDNGLNPLSSDDADEDNDRDNLTNYDEYEEGANPKNADSDDDGIPDGWEAEWRFNPIDGTDFQLDRDEDGYSNLEEYLKGTDPTKLNKDAETKYTYEKDSSDVYVAVGLIAGAVGGAVVISWIYERKSS